MVLVSEDDLAPEEATSDEDFRRDKYEFWSDAFAVPERQPLPPELGSAMWLAACLDQVQLDSSSAQSP